MLSVWWIFTWWKEIVTAPKVKHTDKTQTPKVNKIPEKPSIKSSNVSDKISSKDSSPCLSDHTSDVEVSRFINSKFEICGHRKIGNERLQFNLLNFRTMKTKWLSTETVEDITREDLQECVKQHNLIFRKLSLHEQLRRKREEDPTCNKT